MITTLNQDTITTMQAGIEALKRDYKTLRTGKVNPAILDNITVDYYGTDTELSKVATIIANDATTITISPWEKNLLKDIEQAISTANIGVNPNNNGESVVLYFPPMTVEQRHLSAKSAKAMTDHAKVSIRNNRKHANDIIKQALKDKNITEDDSKQKQEDIQKLTDKFNTKADEIFNTKEAEILKV
ncbi:MAG: ribosome recycling factor [Epsilonproteobacteria bacterium]|nr:MAG: ribosome recycling factor [Campylobacterota bacterium]